VAESRFTPQEIALSQSNVLRKLQTPALGLGAIALIASLAGALIWPKPFFQAWLVAFIFWLANALGSTAILMMQYISGGRWGAAIRRPLEAAAMNVPLMALFFVPVVIGAGYIYPWADEAQVQASAVLQYKSVYLNVPMFVLRAVIYFAIWVTLSTLLVRWSRQNDVEGFDPARAGRTSVLSHIGIIVWLLSMSLASIDWAMSIEPLWFSHIYGLMFAGGQILTALTLAIQVSARVADHRPVSVVISPARFLDVGKLLLAFVMVWTYFQLSQFIIMWGANLPEEVGWYLVRNHGGWEVLTLFLFIFHFAVPFGLLLSRTRKRRPYSIAAVATMLWFMRYVDVFWWITPSFSETFFFHPLHVTTFVGIGGIWVWRYIGNLTAHPVIAVNDPIVSAELEHA
jgi:hypothetical protein